mgnify:CR=1 FL=1
MILDFSQNGIYMVFEVDSENAVSLRHFSNCEKEFERIYKQNFHIYYSFKAFA